MVIYKYTNKISGKVYIGKTVVTPKARHACHVSSAKHGSTTVFAKAIRSYGIENFDYEIIDGANSESELAYLEVHYIHKFNCLVPFGYNLVLGSKAHPITRKESSESRKGCPKNIEMLKSLEGKRVEATAHKVTATNNQTGEVLNFRSMQKAAIFAGVSFSYMQGILKGIKPYKPLNGYDFYFVNKVCGKRKPKRINKRPVKCTHKVSGKVEIFESVSSIEDFGFKMSTINKYLSGSIKNNKSDYQWEYIQDEAA